MTGSASPAPPRVSLAQQLEAVGFARERQAALARGASLKGLRGRSVEEFDVARLASAVRTLEWLMDHEADIKAFLRLPPEGRKAALEMAEAHFRQTHPGPPAGPEG